MKRLAVSLSLALAAASAAVPSRADEPTPSSAAALTNEALEARVQALLSAEEYRDATLALDALLARPGGQLNPVIQALLHLRHGDLRRAAAILVPLSASQGIALHASEDFVPYYLGALAFHMGDREEAERLLRATIARFDLDGRMPRHGPGLVVQALDLLGQSYREAGEHRAARQCIADLRRMYTRESFSPELGALADLHEAELDLAKGDVERAEQALKAVDALLAANPKEVSRPLRARALDARGVLATRMGAHREAEAALNEAIGLRESVFHPSHPLLIDSLRHVSNLYLVMGKRREAVMAAARAEDLSDQRALHLLSIGSARQKRGAARRLRQDTDALVSLHLQHAPDDVMAARVALTAILRRKGLVLDALLGGLSPRRGELDAEERAWTQELVALESRLSTMSSRGPVDATMADFQADLRELEERRRALVDKLASRADRGAKTRIEDQALLELESVQEALADDGALVELVEYHPYRPFGPPVHATWGRPRIAAYVLHRDGDPAWVDLGPSRPIDELGARLLHELSVEGEHRGPARELDALVGAPLRRALGATRRILLSPDGTLGSIPFYALVDERGRDLIETFSITHSMSGRDLLRRGGDTSPARQEALIVANPAFGRTIERETSDRAAAEARAIDLSRLFFPPLGATEEEGRRVHETLKPSRLLLGEEASEEAIKAVHGPRVLHVATHGFFLPDLEPVPGSAAKDAPAAEPWTESPLLRAGLALQGANRRRSHTDREDGVLTALEVARLDLFGTRLVVLSACETGVGQRASGEGVYGLQRALMMAGAETQVTSLWKVNDVATKELMIRYYQHLSGGAGRSEAMRTAQLALRAARPHPYAWAGFVVTGSDASLDGKSPPAVPRALEVRGGPRGCTCTAAESAPSSAPWAAGSIAAIALLRPFRRRGREAGRE